MLADRCAGCFQTLCVFVLFTAVRSMRPFAMAVSKRRNDYESKSCPHSACRSSNRSKSKYLHFCISFIEQVALKSYRAVYRNLSDESGACFKEFTNSHYLAVLENQHNDFRAFANLLLALAHQKRTLWFIVDCFENKVHCRSPSETKCVTSTTWLDNLGTSRWSTDERGASLILVGATEVRLQFYSENKRDMHGYWSNSNVGHFMIKK